MLMALSGQCEAPGAEERGQAARKQRGWASQGPAYRVKALDVSLGLGGDHEGAVAGVRRAVAESR